MESLNRADFIVMKVPKGRERVDLGNEKIHSILESNPSAVFSYAFQELRDLANGKTFRQEELAGMRLMAVSAIADPESFENTLKDCGADVPCAKRFLDHHVYKEKELSDLLQDAKRSGCSLVMTEKDEVKLPEGFPSLILSVRLDWQKGEADLEEALWKAIGINRE